MVRVKICGITNRRDAFGAADAGADAIGFVFHRASPRYVRPGDVRSIVRALPPFVTPVGVFVGGRPADIRAVAAHCGLGLVQVHGPLASSGLAALRPYPLIRAVQVRTRRDLASLRHSRPALFLLDAFHPGLSGGTGRRLDLRLLSGLRLPAPYLLAGGLTPGNVASAVRRIRPWGVDVSAGVECAPGRKDVRKMTRFVRAAKAA